MAKLIREGAHIVTDTNMALSGINKRVLAEFGGEVHSFMADADVAVEAKERGVTRATVSMERAAKLPNKVIFAIGNAPTALLNLREMYGRGEFRPEFVIGVPVGFVNVVAAKEMMMETAKRLNELPLNSLKMHQLQIIRGTRMGADYEARKDDFHIMELDEYIDLAIEFVERLKWDIGIERFVSSSPKDLLIAPQWGLKNFEFTAKIEKRMTELGAYQGKML
jgi:hypothetical protein